VAVGVRAAYDAVAGAYADQFYIELDAKPLDRALLEGFVELAGAGTIADVVRMTTPFGPTVLACVRARPPRGAGLPRSAGLAAHRRRGP